MREEMRSVKTESEDGGEGRREPRRATPGRSGNSKGQRSRLGEWQDRFSSGVSTVGSTWSDGVPEGGTLHVSQQEVMGADHDVNSREGGRENRVPGST
jgi:hypothetical protein